MSRGRLPVSWLFVNILERSYMKKFSLNNIVTPEIDYGFLVSNLDSYHFPRNKINKLLKNGELLRVKKGIYVRTAGEPYSLNCLANMIYGPSYVSQQYALTYYGLIPERVHVVTSMTTGRSKHFYTPVGEFIYEPLERTRYHAGVSCVALDSNRNFLIATPEKALVDLIYKIKIINSENKLRNYLLHDLRLTIGKAGYKFSIPRLKKIANVFNVPLIYLLVDVLKKGQDL